MSGPFRNDGAAAKSDAGEAKPEAAAPASKLSIETQNALLTASSLRRQMRQAERSDPTALDLIGEGSYSALYSATQSPILGLAQIVDRSKVTNLAKQLDYLPAPQPEEFGTKRWHAQQIGGALGMTVPFMATKGTMRMAGLSIAARTEATAATAGRLMTTANAGIVADGIATGFAFDFLTRPVTPADGSFWEARAKNGLTGAATFGALTAGSVGLRHVSRSLAVDLAGTRRVLYDTAIGAGSGAPAGLINAEAHARLFKDRWATTEERKQGIYTMMMVGGTLSALHRLPGQEKPVEQKAMESQERQAGVDNLKVMLAERARITGVEARAQSRNVASDATATARPSPESLIGSQRKGGSSADLLVRESLTRGRALAGADVEATETRKMTTAIAPELLPTLQKGAEMAFKASEPNATPQQVAEFFKFARGDGAALKRNMLEVAENYPDDPRLLTIVREAYLPLEGVEHRVIPGEIKIDPDPGKPPTENQIERWQKFMDLVMDAPTEVDGYAKYRQNVFKWLNDNPDLHNWARQFGDQNSWSNIAGPIDFYFGTSNLGRFVKVSEGKAVDKPVTMQELARMREMSQEFSDQAGTLPYDANLIENFTALVGKTPDVNMTLLARHLNDALAKQKLLSTAVVGAESESQITLYRPKTITKRDSVGKVEYNAEAPVPEGSKFDAKKSNEVANEFARQLHEAKTIEAAQYVLADAALNLKELGVPAKDVPTELNWVLKNNQMSFEVTASETGQIELSYVTVSEGNVPLVSVYKGPDGQLLTKTYE